MVVREFLHTDEPIYSNILTKKVKNNTVITRKDIINKEVDRIKKTGEIVYKYSLNQEYWRNLREANKTINVVIDEAHTLMNPRMSMSKENKIMGDFMALLRRILGASDEGYGELVLITQLERRLDVIAREMATLVQYCVCHYDVVCKTCGVIHKENNETSIKTKRCTCGKKTVRANFIIEVYSFKSIDLFHMWNYSGQKTYFHQHFITDIEKVFPHYDTLQWDNLISED